MTTTGNVDSLHLTVTTLFSMKSCMRLKKYQGDKVTFVAINNKDQVILKSLES